MASRCLNTPLIVGRMGPTKQNISLACLIVGVLFLLFHAGPTTVTTNTWDAPRTDESPNFDQQTQTHMYLRGGLRSRLQYWSNYLKATPSHKGIAEFTANEYAIYGPHPTIGKVCLLNESTPTSERALRTHIHHNSIHNYAQFTLRRQIAQAPWSKSNTILKVLLDELSRPEGERLEWLFWFDVDTIVMNPLVPLDIFLPPPGPEWDHVNLIVAYDDQGLNSGIFLMRVRSWSVNYLAAVLSCSSFQPDEVLAFTEQGAMQRVIEQLPYGRDVIQVPQEWFSQYRFVVNKGDFLIHFAEQGDRDDFMDEWLRKAEEPMNGWPVDVELTRFPNETRAFWAEQSRMQEQHKENFNIAAKRVSSLLEITKVDMEEFGATVEPPARDALWTKVRAAEEVVRHEKSYVSAFSQMHIDTALNALEKAYNSTLAPRVEGATQKAVKAAHNAISAGERILQADPHGVATQGQTNALRIHVDSLKKLLLQVSVARKDVRQEIDHISKAREELETRVKELDRQMAAAQAASSDM
ncbi:hypothetical protein FH972_025887 [Carpinus fangiana]|uniref:Galactosyl transferase GMA12/MNN10 family protein n=1 Tax=Carpinus fangiana TaxID=176857 RepID=A0A5N6L2F0_9ROSI|nr:hypothetical protein FH972_025887 [Carpinus fangiana]